MKISWSRYFRNNLRPAATVLSAIFLTSLVHSVSSTSCGPRCLDCVDNNNSCTSCQNEFYGENCQFDCSTHCLPVNENGTRACDEKAGHCFGSCERGYWGDRCKNTCLNNCIGHVCDRNSGDCSNGCIIYERKYDHCHISQEHPELIPAVLLAFMLLASIPMVVMVYRSIPDERDKGKNNDKNISTSTDRPLPRTIFLRRQIQ